MERGPAGLRCHHDICASIDQMLSDLEVSSCKAFDEWCGMDFGTALKIHTCLYAAINPFVISDRRCQRQIIIAGVLRVAPVNVEKLTRVQDHEMALISKL